MLTAIGFTYNDDTICPGNALVNINSWNNLTENVKVVDLGSTDTTVNSLQAAQIDVVEANIEDALYKPTAVEQAFSSLLENIETDWVVHLRPKYHRIPQVQQGVLVPQLSRLSSKQVYFLSVIDCFNNGYIFEDIGFNRASPVLFNKSAVNRITYRNQYWISEDTKADTSTELTINFVLNSFQQEIRDEIEDYFVTAPQSAKYYHKQIELLIDDANFLVIEDTAYDNPVVGVDIRRMFHRPHWFITANDEKVDTPPESKTQASLQEAKSMEIRFNRYKV